jgi:hypothetical protein
MMKHKKERKKWPDGFSFSLSFRALHSTQCLIRSLLFSQKTFVFEEKEKKGEEKKITAEKAKQNGKRKTFESI